MKRKQINIRINEESKESLEKDAKDEHRSVSSLLIWCWREWRKSKKGKPKREQWLPDGLLD